MISAAAFAWASLSLIVYVYIGYPGLLWLLARFRGREVLRRDFTPSVTLIISAYNEERVIAKKLENTVALEYPKDRLEVIVVSDGSTDTTDQIVASFADMGITLLRQLQREGKTAGLNAGVAKAKGDIIVFSDANIFYQPDAINFLVRNFADPQVACVTGDSRYMDLQSTAAHMQENNYWNYERFIRSMESRLGSTVGGDGAIFAIRRNVYKPLSNDAVHDFLVPLELVCNGFRCVFESRAVGYEPSAGDFKGEFRRKRRIVNQCWHGVMGMPQVLNPRRVGIFAWQIWSHKVLRWLVFPIVLLASAACFIASPLGLPYRMGFWCFLISAASAGIGALIPDRFRRSAWVLHALLYFYLVNIAAAVGIVMASAGRVEVLWNPERR